jgi:hypothetical protein
MDRSQIALLTPQSRELAVELCQTYPQRFSLTQDGTQLAIQGSINQEEGEQLRMYITQFEQETTHHGEPAMKSHHDLIEELMKTVEELKMLTREDRCFHLERFLLSVIDINVERPMLAYLLQNVQTYTRLRQQLPHLFHEKSSSAVSREEHLSRPMHPSEG